MPLCSINQGCATIFINKQLQLVSYPLIDHNANYTMPSDGRVTVQNRVWLREWVCT